MMALFIQQEKPVQDVDYTITNEIVKEVENGT